MVGVPGEEDRNPRISHYTHFLYIQKVLALDFITAADLAQTISHLRLFLRRSGSVSEGRRLVSIGTDR